MKRILIGAAIGAIALTGCGAFSNDRYVAMCVDRYTQEMLPDYMCNAHGAYPVAAPYYLREDRYDTYRSRPLGYRLRGGSLKAPNPRYGKAEVRDAGNPKRITVFEHGKQAGKPVKTIQDPNYGLVTKKQKAKASDPAWGSPSVSKKSSSFGSSKKSTSNSFKSSSSSRRR